MKKRPPKLQTILPEDLDFFILPLNEGSLEITKAIVDRFYQPLPIGSRAYSGTSVTYLSFENEVATATVSMSNESPHKLYLHVELWELHVACECRMKGTDGVCKHAYFGLHELMWRDGRYNLTGIYWPGITGVIKGENRFLSVKPSHSHITVSPRDEYGGIYRAGLGFAGAQSLTFDKPGVVNPQTLPIALDVFGYTIVYSKGYYIGGHLPFLMPFTGRLYKNGQGMSYYHQFVSRETSAALSLTDEQKTLNVMCYDMQAVVLSIGPLPEARHWDSWQHAVPDLLGYWRKAIAMLANQPLLYATVSHGLKEWGVKPKKHRTAPCKVSSDKISISFVLHEHEEYYALEPVIKAGGQEIQMRYNKYPLFVVDAPRNHFCLVSSQQEENLLNWLQDQHWRLTIIRPHLDDFHERFLSKLMVCYPVVYMPLKSRKKVAYNLTRVLQYGN